MSTRGSPRLPLITGSLSLLLWLSGVLLLIHQATTGTPPYEYWRESGLNTLVFSAVGAVVATRRPAHPIGWLLTAVGLISAVLFLSGEYATATLEPGLERLPYGPTSAWLSMIMQITLFFPLLFLLLLFPTGRLLTSRWRIVGWVAACCVSLGIASNALRPGPLEGLAYFNNPFGVDAAAILSLINGAAVWLLTVALLGAVFSLIVRFVRSRGEERQQIKWFAAVAVLGFFTLFGISILSLELGGLGNWIWAIVPASLPIAVGIAILRYRLYDIRHPHKPRSRLRYTDRLARGSLRGEHRAASGGLPSAHRTAVGFGDRSLDARDSGSIHPLQEAYPVLHR